jgi:LytS/YehU family sensor histidine kinase
VAVDAKLTGADLVLTVSDNGPGPLTPLNEGEGIANTRKRLMELYGDRQRFELRAGTGGGAAAIVTLPYHVTAWSAGNGGTA